MSNLKILEPVIYVLYTAAAGILLLGYLKKLYYFLLSRSISLFEPFFEIIHLLFSKNKTAVRNRGFFSIIGFVFIILLILSLPIKRLMLFKTGFIEVIMFYQGVLFFTLLAAKERRDVTSNIRKSFSFEINIVLILVMSIDFIYMLSITESGHLMEIFRNQGTGFKNWNLFRYPFLSISFFTVITGILMENPLGAAVLNIKNRESGSGLVSIFMKGLFLFWITAFYSVMFLGYSESTRVLFIKQFLFINIVFFVTLFLRSRRKRFRFYFYILIPVVFLFLQIIYNYLGLK